MASSRTAEFLDLYRRLETVIKESYGAQLDGGSPVAWLSHRSDFKAIRGELNYCREVRNLLSHKGKIGDDYIVQPSEKMLLTLKETILKVENPPRADNLMVRLESVMTKTVDDLVRPAMEEMLRKSYTHVPIVEDGRVVGVFSENTLLAYLVDEDIVEISRDMRFSDLQAYLPMENHASESFRFVSKDLLGSSISGLFEEGLANGDRIGMIFVTHSGKESQRLLGIITAWDVAALQ